MSPSKGTHNIPRGMTVREIRVKTHDEGVVRNKAIYIAPGILADGTQDILGLSSSLFDGISPAGLFYVPKGSEFSAKQGRFLMLIDRFYPH